MAEFEQKLKMESAQKIKTATYVKPVTGIHGEIARPSAGKRHPEAHINLVRQPNKQGVERFVDNAYEQKLSNIEQQFE